MSPDGQAFIDGLRQLRLARDKDGGYKPYQPLLLMWALGRAVQGEPRSVRFADCVEEVDELMGEFGPAAAATRSTTDMPFWAAGSNPAVWQRHSDDPGKVDPAGSRPSKAALTAFIAGGLPEPVHQAAKDDANFLAAAVGELLALLPTSLGDDVQERCGIDLRARKKRDPKWTELVLMAYEQRCAVCDWDLTLGGKRVGLEAAHVWEWSKGSPNTVDNGVALCSLHHRAYDRGAIAFSDERTVLVSQHALGHHASAALGPLINRPVRAPQTGHEPLNPAFARLHRQSQFRGPARAAPA